MMMMMMLHLFPTIFWHTAWEEVREIWQATIKVIADKVEWTENEGLLCWRFSAQIDTSLCWLANWTWSDLPFLSRSPA
jgi:hypothetical protein